MRNQEVIKIVSKELNLSEKVVREAYNSFFLYIRKRIMDLSFTEDMTLDLFEQLKTNFNIPSLGKLSCTYKRMQGVLKKFKHIKNIKAKR